MAEVREGRGDGVAGGARGGVGKPPDGGTIFTPKFDKQPVQSIGSIAIDPTDTNKVWVGSGEAWTRNSVSIGDGIYHSTDGGETWHNVGLPNSERVVKMIVTPASRSRRTMFHISWRS